MTTTDGLPLYKHARSYLEIIRDRLTYLEDRDAMYRSEGARDNTFVTQEIRALRWAIPVLEAEVDDIVRLRKLVIATEGRQPEPGTQPHARAKHGLDGIDRGWLEKSAHDGVVS
jgi:hypothetical protein